MMMGIDNNNNKFKDEDRANRNNNNKLMIDSYMTVMILITKLIDMLEISSFALWYEFIQHSIVHITHFLSAKHSIKSIHLPVLKSCISLLNAVVSSSAAEECIIKILIVLWLWNWLVILMMHKTATVGN